VLCPAYMEFGDLNGCVGMQQNMYYDCRRSLGEIWEEEEKSEMKRELFFEKARNDYLRLRDVDIHCLFLLSF
jgi:hypothetical protein